MSASVALELDVNGITGNQWNPNIELALIRAINKTADRARTIAARNILEQVAFPTSYLAPSAKRLFVKTKANKSNPFEAIISGRDRPTSLARFTKQKPISGGGPKGGQIGVTVSPGRTHYIKRAFLITLNNGNVGLAVRTTGGPPNNAYKPKSLGNNAWLLYGPSVDQVLSAASDSGGVYQEISPETLEFLNDEFLRQLDLLNAV
jgi:hypothetical protein